MLDIQLGSKAASDLAVASACDTEMKVIKAGRHHAGSVQGRKESDGRLPWMCSRRTADVADKERRHSTSCGITKSATRTRKKRKCVITKDGEADLLSRSTSSTVHIVDSFCWSIVWTRRRLVSTI